MICTGSVVSVVPQATAIPSLNRLHLENLPLLVWYHVAGPGAMRETRLSMHKETDATHKKVVMELFSRDTEYWRKVYEETPEGEAVEGLIQGGIFLTSEMMERKNAVLGFIDRYAGDRKLLALDVGCGTGMTMRDILRRGHSVAGVDITEAMLHQAKAVVSQFDRAWRIVSDVEHMPFADGYFDVVLCLGVLQYLQTDRRAISEIRRVVRDGGLVIITLPNMFKMNNLLDPYYYLVRGVQFIVQKSSLGRKGGSKTLSPVDLRSNSTFANRRYYYGQLSDLLERNNLMQVGIAGIGFGPMTFWRKKLFPDSASMSISRFIQRIALKKYFAFLKIFANRWVICLRNGNPRHTRTLK
jgi:SAM-dependent methyltransferase